LCLLGLPVLGFCCLPSHLMHVEKHPPDHVLLRLLQAPALPAAGRAPRWRHHPSLQRRQQQLQLCTQHVAVVGQHSVAGLPQPRRSSQKALAGCPREVVLGCWIWTWPACSEQQVSHGDFISSELAASTFAALHHMHCTMSCQSWGCQAPGPTYTVLIQRHEGTDTRSLPAVLHVGAVST
jgi:hypothetical protein